MQVISRYKVLVLSFWLSKPTPREREGKGEGIETCFIGRVINTICDGCYP